MIALNYSSMVLLLLRILLHLCYVGDVASRWDLLVVALLEYLIIHSHVCIDFVQEVRAKLELHLVILLLLL